MGASIPDADTDVIADLRPHEENVTTLVIYRVDVDWSFHRPNRAGIYWSRSHLAAARELRQRNSRIPLTCCSIGRA